MAPRDPDIPDIKELKKEVMELEEQVVHLKELLESHTNSKNCHKEILPSWMDKNH